MAAIIFPDTELWWTGHLRTAFADRGRDVHTNIEIPEKRRPLEVIVRRDGGPAEFVTEQARWGIRCFADTNQAVSDLAREAAALMRAARFTGPIRTITTTGPVPVDDPSGRPCMYFTATGTVRGDRLD